TPPPSLNSSAAQSPKNPLEDGARIKPKFLGEYISRQCHTALWPVRRALIFRATRVGLQCPSRRLHIPYAVVGRNRHLGSYNVEYTSSWLTRRLLSPLHRTSNAPREPHPRRRLASDALGPPRPGRPHPRRPSAREHSPRCL